MATPTSALRTEERRCNHRSPVSWPVRLWLGGDLFTIARAIDVSRSGIGLRLSPSLPPGVLRIGEGYRLEVSPGMGDDFLCIAEVRHLDEHRVGLRIRDAVALPADRRKPTRFR